MAQIHVNIRFPRGWKQSEGFALQGALFNQMERVPEKAFMEKVRLQPTVQDLATLLQKLNGFFSLIDQTEAQVVAAVDRVRSMPLFYTVKDGDFFISDSGAYIRGLFPIHDNEDLAEEEFLLTGYVTGKDTLSPKVKQIQAGEVLSVKIVNGILQMSTERYYRYQSERIEDHATYEELLESLNQCMLRSLERLLQFAGGRKIILPLSGGYDSRLLAVMLRKMGHSNVQTFTYGRPGNNDSKVSQEVAQALKIPWMFIPYEKGMWKQCFHAPQREDYFKRAHNEVSVPNIQDWPAVMNLKAQKKIPEDGIFIPGHSGGLISGGHIPESFFESRDITSMQFVDEVFSHHYRLWASEEVNPAIREKLRERIARLANIQASHSPEEAADLYERWDWQERQAKFVVNCVRVYDFWEYDWWLPLWDFEMLEIWRRVPLRWRAKRKLYLDFVTHHYQQVGGVSVHVATRYNKNSLPRRLRLYLDEKGILPSSSHVMKFLRKCFRIYKFNKKRRVDYDRDDMGWFEIIEKSTFKKFHTGHQLFHSYVARYLVGKFPL